MRLWAVTGATTLLVAVLLASCREPTELTLELTTDLPCSGPDPDPLGETSIYVGTAQEMARPLSELTPAAVTHGCLAGKEGRIGSIVVLPSGSDDDRVSIRVVAGRNSARCSTDLSSGCIEARRSLGFVPHTPLYLPVPLRKVCENRPCPNPADTCLDGVCVPSVTNCGENGCTNTGTDAGSVDATPLQDVITPKDGFTPADVGITDAPIPLDVGPPDAGTCAAPVLDGGVPYYTWHFDENGGGKTVEAGGTLGPATLSPNMGWTPGRSLVCGSALAGPTNASPMSLGASPKLASLNFRVDLAIKTTAKSHDFLAVLDTADQTPRWTLGIDSVGNAVASFCGSSCVPLTTVSAVADGNWHTVSLARVGGAAGLAVDGKSATPTSNVVTKSSTDGTLLVSPGGAMDELHFSGK